MQNFVYLFIFFSWPDVLSRSGLKLRLNAYHVIIWEFLQKDLVSYGYITHRHNSSAKVEKIPGNICVNSKGKLSLGALIEKGHIDVFLSYYNHTSITFGGAGIMAPGVRIAWTPSSDK